MGTGKHGGFGNTRGSRSKPIFAPIEYRGTVNIDGVVKVVDRRVYQRNDIDFSYVDPNRGVSNLELMKAGNAPIGIDGRPIQLHHVLQSEPGPVVEIRETTHLEYKRTLHGLVGNGGSFRKNQHLMRQYAGFRRQYWKWRASQFEKGLN